MLFTLLTWGIFGYVGGLPLNSGEFQLIIRRSLFTKECSFISIQPRQTHVDIPVQPGNPSWRAVGEEETFSVLALEEDSLWVHAHSICGSEIAPDPNRTLGFGSTVLQEVLSLSRDTPHKASTPEKEPPSLEIQNLRLSGPSSNRVDLVFFSDGYTREEHDKFIQDASRLAQDISRNQTFSTVNPLLNFWAAFSPSNESGIGTGGKPKDTPFGLYRDGTELRAVYYSKPEVAKAACDSMGDRCDYPILLGNDPFYGGLGGPFTVVTSSLANGPLVLRHELGHSIIYVGEEYDGGYAYYGPNSAKGLYFPLPWSHWLSNPPENPPRIEKSVMPFQTYPWTLLNTSVPWSINFTSSGLYSRHLIRFSLSGLPDRGDLKVELDGRDLEWVPKEGIGRDRWHYDIHRDVGLSAGDHGVKFTLLNKNVEGKAQLCSVEGLEFGNESEFTAAPGYYGIFPTFSETNATTYRPTNEDCLMRDVRKPTLCKVCVEALWLSLLAQVDLLEGVREGCQWTFDFEGRKGRWQKTLEITLVPLAQFRKENISIAESYTMTWRKDGEILETFTNKTRIEMDDDVAMGTYTVEVKFATEEVRLDPEGLLTTGGEYMVTKRCST